MDGFDSLPISDEAEQVDSEDFFVGKIGFGVVALPLLGGVEPSGSASADEQTNADERIFQSVSSGSEAAMSESAMSPRAVCERGLG